MVLRVGGMASGMDTESIIKDLMKAERIPLDKLKQKKQTLEWQRDDYRAMNTLLLDFRTELTQMKLTSKYRSSSVTTSNESRVTATAATSAAQASYSISEVEQLASAAYRVGSSVSSSPSTPVVKVDASKTLESQKASSLNSLTWQQGAVGSQSITSTGGNSVDFKLNAGEAIKEDSLVTPAEEKFSKTMFVSVDGKKFKVVTDAPTAGQNEVQYDPTSGKLNFASGELAANATVKVDYVTNKRVQQTTLTAAVSTFQLDRKEINQADFKLKVGVDTFSIESATTNEKGERVAQLSSGKGTVNLTTGLVTFSGTPIPKDTVITAEFNQNYSDLSIKSYTSKGEVTENFFIQSSDSLNQVISRVNNSNAGVSLVYDSFSDKMSITRKETGNYNGLETDKEMQISGGFDSGVLHLSNAAEAGGENAKFTINGLKTERQSNTFEMSGVSITLKTEFTTADGPVNLSVSKDSNAIYDNIKGFIDKYNTLIVAISKKTSEERYRTYTPLTDDQREQLSDKQQEQWEEKAKSGLLRRDPLLTGVLNSMRSNFSQPVSNSETSAMYQQLATIGITTTANYLEGGKLEINEAKLKEAINTNPNAVEALFRGGSDSSSVGEKGIIHRLYETVNGTMDKLKERAGNSFSTSQQFTLGRQLSTIDNSIDRFEDRLIQVEDRYWKQFTAMEKAMQQANSQSSYLMQQFSM
ncbi:flagellar filament capping protein FliD [Domibacillus sp. PGB-M46]|uniref:flagellar filament capping protein FliD n=1 Tax=Domibacillus sp. PGB-M46 TaxID=2910255 RepID=UPI001F5A1E93|nr:flagellar filament capping protein FliD [Domibacillus sp. PGB-M46]MCI2252980.1 flagellar filament capping protein FliD [Domibacillus sp. PGB-M46]